MTDMDMDMDAKALCDDGSPSQPLIEKDADHSFAHFSNGRLGTSKNSQNGGKQSGSSYRVPSVETTSTLQSHFADFCRKSGEPMNRQLSEPLNIPNNDTGPSHIDCDTAIHATHSLELGGAHRGLSTTLNGRCTNSADTYDRVPVVDHGLEDCNGFSNEHMPLYQCTRSASLSARGILLSKPQTPSSRAPPVKVKSKSVDVYLEISRAEYPRQRANYVGGNSPYPDSSILDHLFSLFQASDNKLAMKLFGSKNALLKEKKRQLDAKNWIIHPCSNFKLYWDITMLIVLATNLVVLPVSIAFFHDDDGAHWMAFNALCDIMFLLDIILNFRTGIISSDAKNEVILDPKLIAVRYLKSWFAVDLISSFPLDYVFLAVKESNGTFEYTTGRALRIFRLAKLLQLLRILRISRLLRYIKLYQEFFSVASTIVRILNLICVMVLLSHWSGCIQFFVPALQGWPEDSWISLYKLHDKPWWEQYSVAVFKALSHMLCIGYGQYAPVNITDTWLTMLSMLAGASCYAMLVGHTTALIQSFDVSSRLFRSHLQQVNEYMLYRKLPVNIKKRITDYYEHRYGGKMFNEAEIMSELSENLQREILVHNCRELMNTVPFFKNSEGNFVEDVITKLNFELFQPGDVIIRLNAVASKLYFIQEGLLEVMKTNGDVVTTLGDGSYFGEIGLLTRSRSTASYKAVTYCNLFSLSRKDFENIIEKYPIIRRTLQTIAAKRLQDLGEDPNIVTSRESLLEDMQHIVAFSDATDDSVPSPSAVCVSVAQSKTLHKGHLFDAFKGFFTKNSDELSRAPCLDEKDDNTSGGTKASP